MRVCYSLCVILGALVVALGTIPAEAQSCGQTYSVVRGDSLSRIANSVYKSAQRWSLIYYANQRTIGSDPSHILPGQRLRIPCSDGTAAAAPAQAAAPAATAAISNPSGGGFTLLTADDYRPFTDRGLPGGGMITDIVRTALETQQEAASGPAFKINWVNDWSAHLKPLLSNQSFDMGFPWFRPNCERYSDLDEPARYRCDTFHFSEPVFEILVLFFTQSDANFQFASDDQVVGKRLCRPAGYFTFDLDKDGRNWVKDEKVSLLRPQSVDECFQMLDRGEIDAVALNEFTGREAVRKLNMTSKVRTIEKPVSVLNLHVIVPKSHPRAQALLGNVNSALKRIRESGKYGEIVERHLAEFWKAQGAS